MTSEISDEELAELRYKLDMQREYPISSAELWRKLIARFDRAESARSEAERERDEWEEAAIYENRQATERMWNNLALKGKLATAEAVIEAARDALPVTGKWVTFKAITALRDALAAYDRALSPESEEA